MALKVTWTRRAMRLPAGVRADLKKRLDRLHRYFPEVRPEITIGITRSYDGLAFQTDAGSVKLMLEVSRRRSGGWRFPTYWTMAHELMHLAQFNSNGIPGGERACDIHALARLPPRYIDDSPSYLVVPRGLRSDWRKDHAELAHGLARKALKRRTSGLRRYAIWWETEFERSVKSLRKTDR